MVSMRLDWNPPRIEIKKARYKWNKNYAAINHEGGISKDGTKFYPRRWTQVAIQRFVNVPLTFQQQYYSTQDIEAAFFNTVEALSQGFNDAMDWEGYDWQGATLRSDGELVTTPRNIVDTGALKHSQTIDFE